MNLPPLGGWATHQKPAFEARTGELRAVEYTLILEKVGMVPPAGFEPADEQTSLNRSHQPLPFLSC
jgi:hypothetical protein